MTCGCFVVLLKYIDNQRRIQVLLPRERQVIFDNAKVVFTRYPPQDVDAVWQQLPINVQEVCAPYRRCFQHHNRPWQRTHIDGPAPFVKDCHLCKT